MNERRVEQLYLFVSTLEANPPTTALGEDELAAQHMAFIQQLKDQGRLVGAGSLRDSDGTRYTVRGIKTAMRLPAASSSSVAMAWPRPRRWPARNPTAGRVSGESRSCRGGGPGSRIEPHCHEDRSGWNTNCLARVDISKMAVAGVVEGACRAFRRLRATVNIGRCRAG